MDLVEAVGRDAHALVGDLDVHHLQLLSHRRCLLVDVVFDHDALCPRAKGVADEVADNVSELFGVPTGELRDRRTDVALYAPRLAMCTRRGTETTGEITNVLPKVDGDKVRPAEAHVERARGVQRLDVPHALDRRLRHGRGSCGDVGAVLEERRCVLKGLVDDKCLLCRGRSFVGGCKQVTHEEQTTVRAVNELSGDNVQSHRHDLLRRVDHGDFDGIDLLHHLVFLSELCLVHVAEKARLALLIHESQDRRAQTRLHVEASYELRAVVPQCDRHVLAEAYEHDVLVQDGGIDAKHFVFIFTANIEH
eukprot:PhM_4_TR2110/c2_g1_i1/m.57483